uniref:Ovule protein n=1 Tax=Heterorhabditis bacteriophora TaxID=37862 RepID=A0A1I7WHI1_HETBA
MSPFLYFKTKICNCKSCRILICLKDTPLVNLSSLKIVVVANRRVTDNNNVTLLSCHQIFKIIMKLVD